MDCKILSGGDLDLDLGLLLTTPDPRAKAVVPENRKEKLQLRYYGINQRGGATHAECHIRHKKPVKTTKLFRPGL